MKLAHSFNIKSEESIFKYSPFENKYLIGAFLLGAFLQVGVALIKPVADVFQLVMLSKEQWLYTILISISPIAIIEIQKKLNTLRKGRIVYESSVKVAQN